MNAGGGPEIELQYPVPGKKTPAHQCDPCARMRPCVPCVCVPAPPGVFLPLFTILPVQYSMYSVGGARALPHRYIVQ